MPYSCASPPDGGGTGWSEVVTMTTFGTRLFTWFKGEFVGEDDQGNRYYRERRPGRRRRGSRWVIYKGRVEASKVPPDWNAWLHHTVGETPVERPLTEHSWEKAHLSNLTGTPAAYRPPGHMLKGGRRDRATGDYEPWRPD